MILEILTALHAALAAACWIPLQPMLLGVTNGLRVQHLLIQSCMYMYITLPNYNRISPKLLEHTQTASFNGLLSPVFIKLCVL